MAFPSCIWLKQWKKKQRFLLNLDRATWKRFTLVECNDENYEGEEKLIKLIIKLMIVVNLNHQNTI